MNTDTNVVAYMYSLNNAMKKKKKKNPMKRGRTSI